MQVSMLTTPSQSANMRKTAWQVAHQAPPFGRSHEQDLEKPEATPKSSSRARKQGRGRKRQSHRAAARGKKRRKQREKNQLGSARKERKRAGKEAESAEPRARAGKARPKKREGGQRTCVRYFLLIMKRSIKHARKTQEPSLQNDR